MLRYGFYYKEDREVMEWLKTNYETYNIADKTTYELTKFINSLSSNKNRNLNKEKIFELEKAIRQDMKKMLLGAKIIYEYSKTDRSNDPLFCEDEEGYAIPYYNEDKDITQIQMEYFITKYRVIIEYTTNIICKLIKFDKNKFKEMHPDKIDKNKKLVLKDFEIKKLKMEYFEKIILAYNNLDKSRFEAIRHIRNNVIHNGASCLIFDGEELLFQIYDLNVDEIICAEDYLSNGNAISCKYFIATSIAYLVYYLNKVFTALLNDKVTYNSDIPYCSKGYVIDEIEESNMYTEHLEKYFGLTFDNISNSQKCIMEIIDEYLKDN